MQINGSLLFFVLFFATPSQQLGRSKIEKLIKCIGILCTDICASAAHAHAHTQNSDQVQGTTTNKTIPKSNNNNNSSSNAINIEMCVPAFLFVILCASVFIVLCTQSYGMNKRTCYYAAVKCTHWMNVLAQSSKLTFNDI